VIVATAVLVGLTLLAVAVARRQAPGRARDGALLGLSMLRGTLPLLVAAFFVAGMLAAALPPTLVHHFLGGSSNLLDVVVGSIAGALIPGGPYVSFPIIAAIHAAGASLPATVSMVTGWAVWNLGILSFELALVGPRFTVVRVSATLLLPPLAGVVTRLLFG
jgi:uncharacterized protein